MGRNQITITIAYALPLLNGQFFLRQLVIMTTSLGLPVKNNVTTQQPNWLPNLNSRS